MAGEKTFRTSFLIGAKWVGAKGVQEAQRGLTLLERHAQRSRKAFRGMTGSVFAGMSAYGLASKAIEGFTTVLVKSFAAASEAQEAHDELGLSVERMAKRYKNTMGKSVAETSAIVEESTQALIKASEQMEVTGHDAEVLQHGFARLASTGALDPKQILAQREAFSDVLSYTSGANANAQESAQLGEAWADAILRGNIALLKQMDLTDGEIQLLKNVNTQVKKGAISGEEGIKRRQDLLLKFAKKFEGETIRVFQRPSGKIAQMWTQVGNVFETLGEPFVDRAPEMAEAFKKIAVEVEPIARELAEMTGEGLKNFAKWLDEGGASTIVKNLGHIVTALKGMEDALNAINKAVTFKQSIWEWLQGVGEPAKRPQLKGAPSQEPIPGGAGTGGKAAERAAEGRARIEAKAKATKYMPYLRDLQQVSAAAAPGATRAAANAQSATASPAGGGGGATAALKSERARVGAELAADPELQRLLAASVLAEMGDQSPAAQQQYMETVMNRAAARGQSLYAILSDPKYYPKATKDRLSAKINPQEAARMQSMSADVLAGSNLANFATGNESLNVGYKSRARGIWMPILARAQGRGGYERFVGEPDTRDWVERMQKKGAAPAKSWYASEAEEKSTGGKGPNYDAPKTSSLGGIIKGMNLQRAGGAVGGQSMHATNNITVNGVAPGREALMARKTALALRDPIQEGLRQLKEMQSQSARVGYV